MALSLLIFMCPFSCFFDVFPFGSNDITSCRERRRNWTKELHNFVTMTSCNKQATVSTDDVYLQVGSAGTWRPEGANS